NDDNTLPVQANTRVAVIGAFATEPRFQGGGSSHINPTRVDAALDAIRDQTRTDGVTVDHAAGFTLDGSGDPGELTGDATAVAGRADIAIVFVGLSDREESEGFD